MFEKCKFYHSPVFIQLNTLKLHGIYYNERKYKCIKIKVSTTKVYRLLNLIIIVLYLEINKLINFIK